MTSDEELELTRHVLSNDQQSQSAGSRLVEANLAKVVSIAEGYPASGIRVMDLILEGNAGLLFALETFAGSSCESFSAHAAACIRNAIAKLVAKGRPAGEPAPASG